MGLQSIEQALERMVDSVFSRSSRTTLRPVELGRRLLRDIDDHRTVDVKGRRVVPNAFTFYLSPVDHAGFADIDHALRHELAEAAREYARDEGYVLVGPVTVTFEVDNHLKQGRFGIFSHVREQPLVNPPAPAPAPAAAAPAAPATAPAAAPAPLMEPLPLPGFTVEPAAGEPVAGLALEGAAREAAAAAPAAAALAAAAAAAAAAAPAAPVGHSVVLPDGRRVMVTAHAVTIGRLPECTVVLNDANVSRRHAELRRGLHGTMLVDLGSTNGTKVNGQRITGEHPLSPGDIITMGNTHLRFEAS